MALRTAVESRAAQARLTAAVLAQMRRSWRRLDYANLDGSWSRIAADMLLVLTAGQRASAAQGASSVSRMLEEQNAADDPAGQVNPNALAGVASDGRPLETLLYQPVIATKVAIGNGANQATATASGSYVLDRIVHTQMWDAHRVATGIGITARRNVGYVRMLTPPSCSRCAILAGKWYRWRADFERHGNCDCTQIPAAEDAAGDLRTDPMEAFRSGQIGSRNSDGSFRQGLSQAERQAISDGADISQVVNAHRGMSTTTIFRRKISVTSEGTTLRGVAGQRLAEQGLTRLPGSRYRTARTPRITPGQIYRDAESREQAIELLERFGYII